MKECQKIIRDHKEKREGSRKRILTDKSYEFCRKSFVYVREIFVLIGIGGPYWYHTGVDGVVDKAIKCLDELIKKLFGLNLEVRNEVSLDEAGAEDMGPPEAEVFDFNPDADVGGGGIGGDAAGGGRAAFLAKHLKNTMRLKECLDQGYKQKAGS